MKFGFALRRLTLTGPGKVAAEVEFTMGLNVIAGPSDTGKSFIVRCIDFALGSGDLPKEIPESQGYSTVVLEIEAYKDHRVYTLERSLRGGEILCKTTEQPNRTLAAKHQGNKEDTVSQFLLDLAGLGTKKVRTNQQGKTRPLSFRDIVRLVIIDEERVIKEDSPILSGQVIHKTVESGVFRLLLTGTDDSSLIPQEDLKVAKGRAAGRVELLEELLKKTRERMSVFGDVSTLSEERDRLAQIETSIQTARHERNAAQASVVPLQTKRVTTWTALRAIESKLAVVSELQTRFDLLQAQYSSDLRRLETIAEAGVWLDHLKEERCPICGALAEHHDHAHLGPRPEPADISLACKAEAAKTYKLLQDLRITQVATAAEVEQLQGTRENLQSELNAIHAELKGLIDQKVEVAAKKVDDLQVRAQTCRNVIEILEQIQELGVLLEQANKTKRRQRTSTAGAAVSTAQADPFSQEVEELLKEWHFPDLLRVSFSENDQDIVISGRARKSHGKGVRAITHAAFTLALLRLCLEDERPFPNFVLIDSPLLVYEEPDADESSFPPDVKKRFWESLKTTFNATQVIIIENSKQLPTDGTIREVNVVLFTGNDQGRRGFIPQVRNA